LLFFSHRFSLELYSVCIVEQDHRFIKWRIINGLGFKNFESAQRTLSGIEVVRMIRKDQYEKPKSSYFKTFTSLAA